MEEVGASVQEEVDALKAKLLDASEIIRLERYFSKKMML